MKILNFYIILETFLVTGLITFSQLGAEYKVFRIIISIAIIFFSGIFLALDTRTKEMIKYSEDALRKIEQKNVTKYGADVMIFSIEQEKTPSKRKQCWGARHFLSYSKLLHWIVLFFCLIGLLSIYLQVCHN